MKSLAATLLLLFSLNVVAQDSSKPKISPFFDRVDDGPAFFVDCRNASGRTLSSGAAIWTRSVRIDGKLVPDDGHALQGLTMEVPPGEFWRGIIVFPQSQRPFLSGPTFGALSRRDRPVPLSEGKHTIAVQCGGEWSDEISFYWETETRNPFSGAKNPNITE